VELVEEIKQGSSLILRRGNRNPFLLEEAYTKKGNENFMQMMYVLKYVKSCKTKRRTFPLKEGP